MNELSKQVGRLRRDGADDEAERLMAESRELGQTEAALADEAGDAGGRAARAAAAHPQPAVGATRPTG